MKEMNLTDGFDSNFDMTYQEIELIKLDISKFIRKISTISENFDFEILDLDKNFFSFVAKHLIFIKHLQSGDKNNLFYKILISDLYHLILAIIKGEVRYTYLNERSIIENYIRLILRDTTRDNHVTRYTFETFKNTRFKSDLTDNDYMLIRSEYRTACQYIHGNDILKPNLISVLDDYLNKSITLKQRRKYYSRLQSLLKIFSKLFISNNPLFVSDCFHRKKSVLTYLVGASMTELIFKSS